MPGGSANNTMTPRILRHTPSSSMTPTPAGRNSHTFGGREPALNQYSRARGRHTDQSQPAVGTPK